MSLNNDLANDLANVFYEDISTVATINSQPVKGYLKKEDSDFGMDSQTYLFDAPAVYLKEVRRGDAVTIENVLYRVARVDYETARSILVLDVG
jgi:hypothetical protein